MANKYIDANGNNIYFGTAGSAVANSFKNSTKTSDTISASLDSSSGYVIKGFTYQGETLYKMPSIAYSPVARTREYHDSASSTDDEILVTNNNSYSCKLSLRYNNISYSLGSISGNVSEQLFTIPSNIFSNNTSYYLYFTKDGYEDSSYTTYTSPAERTTLTVYAYPFNDVTSSYGNTYLSTNGGTYVLSKGTLNGHAYETTTNVTSDGTLWLRVGMTMSCYITTGATSYYSPTYSGASYSTTLTRNAYASLYIWWKTSVKTSLTNCHFSDTTSSTKSVDVYCAGKYDSTSVPYTTMTVSTDTGYTEGMNNSMSDDVSKYLSFHLTYNTANTWTFNYYFTDNDPDRQLNYSMSIAANVKEKKNITDFYLTSYTLDDGYVRQVYVSNSSGVNCTLYYAYLYYTNTSGASTYHDCTSEVTSTWASGGTKVFTPNVQYQTGTTQRLDIWVKPDDSEAYYDATFSFSIP